MVNEAVTGVFDESLSRSLFDEPSRTWTQHERAGRAGMCACRAAGSTAGGTNDRKAQPAATAILHGLARRTAPQTKGIVTRSRASRAEPSIQD